jgi:hypothetical protein
MIVMVFMMMAVVVRISMTTLYKYVNDGKKNEMQKGRKQIRWMCSGSAAM